MASEDSRRRIPVGHCEYEPLVTTCGSETVGFVVGSQASIDALENHVMLHLSAFSYAIKREGATGHLFMDERSDTPPTSLVFEVTILRAYGGRELMIAQRNMVPGF